MSNSILHFQKLIHIYENDDPRLNIIALRDININLENWNVIIITGPSGSGKTTLLNILSGILRPTAGSININNYRITDLNQKELNNFYMKKVGYLKQNPRENVIEGITVQEFIELNLQLYDLDYDKKEVDGILTQLSIDHLKQENISYLSGGEIQRVAIASIILKKNEIIIADEPTAHLDEKNSVKLIKLILSLQDKYNFSVIIASHDDLLREFSDVSLVISDGKLEEIE
ncbi:MAG: ABC transporter ATP-binding protein [Candidatus Heimdallarchaeota archaeon]|nr:ABC transporter ATP-binding protein [Candidatus Heimdallarchaeota archaeon]